MKKLILLLTTALVVGCSSTPVAPPPVPAAPIEITRADVQVLQAKLPAIGRAHFSLPSGKSASCDPMRCELEWIERSVPVIGLKRPATPDLKVELILSAGSFGELLGAMDAAKSQKTLISQTSSLGEIRCNSSRCEIH